MYIIFFLNAGFCEKLPAAIVSWRHQGTTGHINIGSTNLSECGRTSKLNPPQKKRKRKKKKEHPSQ